MNSIGAIILSLLILFVFCASRRLAALGMIAGVMFLTQAQAINVAGLNLYAFRFLELAAFVRIIARREFSFRQLNGIDKILLCLYGYTTIIFLIRSTDGQAYAIGTAVDAFLCYFSFRGLINTPEDLRRFLRAFILLLALYAMLVVMESRTGHNPFVALGGMAGGGEWMRHDRPRCFGSFRQPDTLGMFAASFIPLYIGMTFVNKERKLASVGIGLCLVIVWAANAGGAASAAGMGVFGWLFWRTRTQMRKVRWGIVGLLAALALVMKAPIWYVFAKASSITGGGGWHRSYLIDVAFQHLGNWWYWGMPINETSGWFPYDLGTMDQADITNQYISFGLGAGLLSIMFFIVLLKRAYAALGQALEVLSSSAMETRGNEYLLWGLGVMLAVHIVNWFGITYFDQMYVVWYMQLAAISGISCMTMSCMALKTRTSIKSEVKVGEMANMDSYQSDHPLANPK